MKNSLRYILLFITVTCTASLGRAASIATDGAADPAYTDGWQSGDNGGSGWGSAWTLTPSGSGAAFSVGNSAANGAGDTAAPIGDINTPQSVSGRAWGLAASTGSTATASRAFGGNLSVGDIFTLDYDSGPLTSGAVAGFRLLNASGNTLWELDYSGGNGVLTITDASGNGGKSASFTDQGVRFSFTLLSATTYTVSATPLGSSSSVGKSGSLISTTGGTGISNFALFFSGNAASTTANQQIFQ